MKLFWTIWVLTITLLLLTLSKQEILRTIFFLALFALLGILAYSLETNKKSFSGIRETIERIDFRPLENGIRRIETAQGECYLRLSNIEAELEDYKHEQERRYREVVRKVLELDNKFNRKFKLLGEAVIKLGKERKD